MRGCNTNSNILLRHLTVQTLYSEVDLKMKVECVPTGYHHTLADVSSLLLFSIQLLIYSLSQKTFDNTSVEKLPLAANGFQNTALYTKHTTFNRQHLYFYSKKPHMSMRKQLQRSARMRCHIVHTSYRYSFNKNLPQKYKFYVSSS